MVHAKVKLRSLQLFLILKQEIKQEPKKHGMLCPIKCPNYQGLLFTEDKCKEPPFIS